MKVNANIVVNINEKIPAVIHNDVYHALQVGAEALLTEALKTTPIDTGALRQTGKTSGDIVTLTTAVSFDTPYAVRLHEHPEYRFQPTGRGKWLELTLQEEKQMLISLIGATISARINQGGGI